MSEEEKKIIKGMKELIKKYENSEDELDKQLVSENKTLLNLIEKQQKELELKDKVIEEMANEIFIEHNPHFKTTEEVKECFRKKAKENKE